MSKTNKGGEHKAAKDLLTAIKVIEDTPQLQQTIVIGIGGQASSGPDPWPQDVVVEAVSVSDNAQSTSPDILLSPIDTPDN
jgi:hypothetical protein